MTIFDSSIGRGRVLDGGGGRGVLGLIGLAIVGLVVLILLFNSVTRVGTGRVGVLTLFGRVTGETLPIPGVWTFTVTVRTSDIDAGVGAISIPLGQGQR